MPYTIIKCNGKDALSFIHAKASNELKKLNNEAGTFAAFLQAKGHISGLCFVIKNSEEDICIVSAANKAQQLKEHLEKYAIIEEVSFSIAAENLKHDQLIEKLQETSLDLPKEITDSKFSLEDFSETDNLIKLNLIDKYVSFEKGCFPGQEVLSKYKNVGLKKREERSRQYTDEALELFAQAKEGESHEKAIELLRKAITENPKNEDAYESLGVMLGREEKYDEAIKIMQQLELINPQSIMAQTNLSIFYMKIGDKEKAEEHKAKGTVLQFDEALK